jgi:hypothetical protein
MSALTLEQIAQFDALERRSEVVQDSLSVSGTTFDMVIISTTVPCFSPASGAE